MLARFRMLISMVPMISAGAMPRTCKTVAHHSQSFWMRVNGRVELLSPTWTSVNLNAMLHSKQQCCLMVKTTCDRVGLASAISFGHWPACCENNKALSFRILFSLGVHASLYAGRSHYIIGWQLRPTHTHRLMREHGCWWSESYHDIYTNSIL